MFQIKCVLFAVVAAMVVDSTVAIIGGQDAARGQFPYFAYIESYKTPDLPVDLIDSYIASRKILN